MDHKEINLQGESDRGDYLAVESRRVIAPPDSFVAKLAKQFCQASCVAFLAWTKIMQPFRLNMQL